MTHPYKISVEQGQKEHSEIIQRYNQELAGEPEA